MLSLIANLDTAIQKGVDHAAFAVMRTFGVRKSFVSYAMTPTSEREARDGDECGGGGVVNDNDKHIAVLKEAIDRYRSRDYVDENLVRNYGQEFAEACLDALKFQASAAPTGEYEEREHCLNVARSWGLEGDRVHAQAYRLYEQRREARAFGTEHREAASRLLSALAAHPPTPEGAGGFGWLDPESAEAARTLL